MSAYDLANEVMEHYNAEKQKGFNVNWMQEVANMLRKQAKELDEAGHMIGVLREYISDLENGLDSSIKLNKAQAERQVKELTDEEILQFQDKVPYTLGSDLIAFARAILKKVQEK
jgi:hypothetical protein